MESLKSAYFSSDFQGKKEIWKEIRENTKGKKLPEVLEAIRHDFVVNGILHLLGKGDPSHENEWHEIQRIDDFNNMEAIHDHLEKAQEEITEILGYFTNAAEQNMFLLEEHDNYMKDFAKKLGEGKMYINVDKLSLYYITEDGKKYVRK